MQRDCELCGQPAQRQFTEVVKGERQTVHICLDCAEKLGVTGSPPPAPKPPVAQIKITAEIKTTAPASALPTAPRRCQNCGMTLVAVRKSGRVGCPECYEAFRDHLEPLLRRVHGALEHRGIEHRERADRPAGLRELQRLRGELERAIENEDFEGAARLRDEISRLHRSRDEGETP